MLSKREVLRIFKDAGVLQSGHFQLSSGLHSNRYLQCAKVFQYPRYAKVLAEELARRFKKERVDLVIGPALGGVILSYEVARSLRKARALFAEREKEKMSLRRGFKIEKGEKALVVEDVITTGGSVKEVIELVKRLGGEVIGVGALVERSGKRINFGLRTETLLKIRIENYQKEVCPLCKKDTPLLKPGSRENR